MSALETVRQANMFSGEWETRYTRNQLQQMPMFSLSETFEFGVQARPYLLEAPRPTLELISEDVRTPEEIERDLMREAEEMTSPMFATEALVDDEDESKQEAVEGEGDQRQLENSVDDKGDTKLSCYLALVNLTREQAMTLWVDEVYRGRFYSQLPQAILAAQSMGLTTSEISAAMQIGEFLGNRERQSANNKSETIFDGRRENTSSSLSPSSVTEGVRKHEGLRTQLRHDRVSVRARHPKPQAPSVLPLHWMQPEHIQKRLPYLAEGIAQLNEGELTSLAESISEALEETFWTVLGITLTHYLDHEQREKTA